MDRTINGDDLRLLDRLAGRPAAAPAPAPGLDALPGWFRQLVREQAPALGCAELFPELFPEPARQPAPRRAA